MDSLGRHRRGPVLVSGVHANFHAHVSAKSGLCSAYVRIMRCEIYVTTVVHDTTRSSQATRRREIVNSTSLRRGRQSFPHEAGARGRGVCLLAILPVVKTRHCNEREWRDAS
jgi:hypothetical protein